MPRVGIVFELRHCDTRPGEMVCVRGSLGRLGGWALDSPDAVALRLQTDPSRYPRWVSRAPVWIDTAECMSTDDQQDDLRIQESLMLNFQYKYLKDRRAFASDPSTLARAYTWEAAVPNREVSMTVEDGAIFVVSDESWNSLGQSVVTQIRKTEAEDVRKPALPQGEPKGWAKWSFILSPRGREEKTDVQFSIEQEFSALDQSMQKVPSKSQFFEKQSEALRLENALLRQRLHGLEAAVSQSQYGYLLNPHLMPDGADLTDTSACDSEPSGLCLSALHPEESGSAGSLG